MVKPFVEKHLVSILCWTAVAFVLAGFSWSLVALAPIRATPIILHFNDIDGITAVGGLGTIVFMGVFGLLIVLMDFAIAHELDSRGRRFLGRYLAATALIFAILLFIAFLAIVNVNV